MLGLNRLIHKEALNMVSQYDGHTPGTLHILGQPPASDQGQHTLGVRAKYVALMHAVG